MYRLYSEFVSAGDLVFDIGANIGDYAEMFARLGARVVAVEPNPELIVDLKKSDRGIQ
ncbi:MAG TPA: FkbM family methyltransferase [Candidatus Acidoferrum sp.]